MSKKSRYEDHEQTGMGTDAAPAHTEAETPPDQRARELLTALSEAQKHNAPVTMWMLNELRDLIGLFTGQEIAKPLHAIRDSRGHSTNVTFKDDAGNTLVIDTVEEALAYVRGLPLERQKQPHWRLADKMLEEASHYLDSADVSPAARAFENAVHADTAANPRKVEVPARDPSLDPPKPAPAPEPEPAHVPS
jgi:hypothetical protein